MTDTFFKFILETTKDNFISSQNEVFEHAEYDPYSDDLNIIERFLDDDDFSNALAYNSINTVLSARAHLYKNYALGKLGKEEDSQSELVFAQKIMEGISLTGNGSKESPYMVIRVSDEQDMLRYFQEEFISQSLVKDEGRFFDLITCKSGRKVYFDITKPYLKMKELMDNATGEDPIQKMLNKDTITEKKWWEFWK